MGLIPMVVEQTGRGERAYAHAAEGGDLINGVVTTWRKRAGFATAAKD